MDHVNLYEAAKKVCQCSYSPYSHFKVGAAVADENGRIYTGTNVENASYGLTLCAERNAITHAISCGALKILGVVIYTPTDIPTPPCGACRQVIAEFASSNCEVVSICNSEKILSTNIGALLPENFSLDSPK